MKSVPDFGDNPEPNPHVKFSHDKTLVDWVHDILTTNMTMPIDVNRDTGVITIESHSTNVVHELHFKRVR